MRASSLAADLLRVLDPCAVAHDVGLTLDGWQGELLESSDPRILINAHRQSGKSTTCGFLAANEAVSNPGLILCASPSLRQSTELFRKICQTLRAVKGAPGFAVESVTKLELENGARIVSLPGSESTVRGYSSPVLVLLDEAARIPDDLYGAIRPMLAAGGGRLIALSTPWGRKGWFFNSWQDGGDSWRRFLIPATESTRITAERLAEELREIGPLRFKSDYLCEFVDDSEQLFPSGLIAAALSDEVLPIWT